MSELTSKKQLLENLRCVPKSQKIKTGKNEYFLIGNVVHEAAAEIERLQHVNGQLHESLKSMHKSCDDWMDECQRINASTSGVKGSGDEGKDSGLALEPLSEPADPRLSAQSLAVASQRFDDPLHQGIFAEGYIAGRASQPPRVDYPAAIRLTWEMIDPTRPSGQEGSYARGRHNGICDALHQLAANIETQRRALTKLVGYSCPIHATPDAFCACCDTEKRVTQGEVCG